ncbi:MAG: phosphoserine transaminase [Acidimicrobiales bacterium]
MTPHATAGSRPGDQAVADRVAGGLRLPEDLLPSDGRFGSGPTKVRTGSLDALAATGAHLLGTSHRRPAVKSLVARVRRGLAELLTLPEGYEVILGNGGTTAFWDASTFCLIEHKSEHLTFGEFSSRFAEAARLAPHISDPLVVASPPGTHPGPVASPEVDLYALTHNETSTGVSMEVTRPVPSGSGPGAGGALVAVDATSAAGALRVDPATFDVYYFSPQKALGSEGGLFLAAVSPAAVQRIESIAAAARWVPAFLDLKVALDNSRLDQTYNTPALATLFLLADQLDWMLGSGGLEAAARRCDRSAEILYGWAETSELARPFVDKPDERSHVTGTIDFDGSLSADALAAALRANGIVDTEPYRKLGRNQLRIAMFPAIDPDDVAKLTACIDWLAERMSTGPTITSPTITSPTITS